MHQTFPERDRAPGLGEQLEAQRLAGVAGACDDDVAAIRAGDAQPVALVLGQLRLADDLLQQHGGVRALQRDHAQVVADVEHVDVVPAPVLLQPLPILVAVGGVDDQQKAVLGQAVEVGVVDGATLLVGDEGVVGIVRGQGPRVVGQDTAEVGLGARTPELVPAHVGDVEQAGVPPGGEVLADGPGLVLDGHVPAAEVYHLGAAGAVPVVKHGLAKGRLEILQHGSSPLVFVSCWGSLPRSYSAAVVRASTPGAGRLGSRSGTG